MDNNMRKLIAEDDRAALPQNRKFKKKGPHVNDIFNDQGISFF